jgi:hypothetical protein
MSFAERAKTKPEIGYSRLEDLIDSLEGDELDGVLSMLRNLNWTITELVEEFQAEGYQFGKDQFSRWRRANNVVRR